MKRLATLLFTGLLTLPAAAQELGYSSSQPLQLPRDTFFGMAAGVATNSKGNVFVYTRNGDPTITLGGSRATTVSSEVFRRCQWTVTVPMRTVLSTTSCSEVRTGTGLTAHPHMLAVSRIATGNEGARKKGTVDHRRTRVARRSNWIRYHR